MSARRNSRWQQRQDRDPYVRMARRDGWRSRAVYKLQQLDEKEHLLQPDMTCVDLGAAPGSWSQYLSYRLKGRVRLIALDLLAMDALPSVEYIQGDFTEKAVLMRLLDSLDESKADLVLSDMAPNISGSKAIDQPKSMYLAELALDLARQVLRHHGSFICKVFQGQGCEAFLKDVRTTFDQARLVKPKASRAGSSEVYLVARNYQL